MSEKTIDQITDKRIPIMLDKERKLFLGFSALKFLAEKYESGPIAIDDLVKMSGDGNTMTKEFLTLMSDVLTALLLDDDPEVDQEAVEKSIKGLDDISRILEAMGHCIALNMPSAKEAAAGDIENPTQE